jgi:hypothetical protein
MNHIEIELKKILDLHAKEMHRILREMEPQSRLEYIKDMLPSLLCFSHPAPVPAHQKLQETMKSPLQNLTQRELNLIHDLAAKTENLYNSMNNGNYFG